MTTAVAMAGSNLFDTYYSNEAYTDQDVNGSSFIRAVPAAPRSIMVSAKVGF